MDYNKVYEIVLQTKDIILAGVANVHNKAKHDFVTNIDLQVNDFLKAELYKLYPNIQFFSEEEESILSDNCWILDPIDGTTNLIFDYKMSAVSLAHYVNGEVVFGMVYNPFTSEAFSAVKGQGAYLNNKKLLSVSNNALVDSLIEFGAGSGNKLNAEHSFAIALDIFKNSLDIRRICSSALAICYIAAARIDGCFEILLKPWDYAAGQLILTEAGGRLSDYQGNPLQFAKPTTLVASNTVNYYEMLTVIKKYIR